MTHEKKTIGIILASAALVLLIAFFAWRGGLRRTTDSLESGTVQNSDLENRKTVEPIQERVEIPGQHRTGLPENIAIPEMVQASTPYVTTSDREFSITISGGKFTPDTIIVREGDIGRIRFTARDRTYDVVQPDYGLRIALQKGETKLMASQFNTIGKYTFYCESCGGPAQGPRGYVMVVPSGE